MVTSNAPESKVCPCLPRMDSVEALSVYSIDHYPQYAEQCKPSSGNKLLKYIQNNFVDDEAFLNALCRECLRELSDAYYERTQEDINYP